MGTIVKTLISVGASLAMIGCVGLSLGGDHVRWTEEVKLSDGRVIEIQQHVELTESGFPLQKRGFDKYHEFCYPPLGIRWKSRPGYQPDIFDIVDGKAYVHVPVTTQVQCYEQGSPATGAIYFRWDNDHWERISPGEFPAAAEWNLLMQISGGSRATDPRGKVTVKDKTTGDWNDSSLRFEQKRFGWKRTNESYASREGCKRWGGGPANFGIPDIFMHDGKSICQP